MTRRSGFLILLGLLLADHVAAAPSEGKCSEAAYAAVGRHLQIENFKPREQSGSVFSEVCRTWPDDSNLVFSAFAYDAGVDNEKQIIVAVVDKKSRRVIRSYTRSVYEDAITEFGEGSLVMHAVRYQLAADVKAFGVQFRSAAWARCAEGGQGDELTLFVPRGRQLRPVLTLHLDQQKSIRGCVNPSFPSAIWHDARITLAVEDATTSGLHDMRATARIAVVSNGEPAPRIEKPVQHYIFRYDGKSYKKGKLAPWWLGI